MKFNADEINHFWIEETGPKGWYNQSDALDDKIRERYFALWEEARKGTWGEQQCHPAGSLALLILFDQFPRNMFRGDPRSFATDERARGLAKKAISAGHDMKASELARQFYYMPLMHSEILADQEHCVRLIKMNMKGDSTLRHARAHRAVIREFGRFPARNAALSRVSTKLELAYLDEGGYAVTLREFAE